MNIRIFILVSLFLPVFVSAQEMPGADQFGFERQIDLDATSIKNQQQTGTCWSFSTVSFLESEMIRTGKEPIDLSEMFIVNGIYREKAENYVYRQGKTNFSQGALGHDVIHGYEKYGIVPESLYDGLPEDEEVLNHSELDAALGGMLEGIVKNKGGQYWMEAVDALLDVYMGDMPSQFTYEGKSYTPHTFANEKVGLDPHDYVELTSFTHIPDYREFVLEVPDNFSSGNYFNVSLKELTSTVEHALENGYTVVWDCDVSEDGFKAKQGYAIMPVESGAAEAGLPKEINVTREMRQEAYQTYSTTDDHLMHITGTATDKNGKTYFTVKNSWGSIGPFDGYLYASIPYFEMKTIGILLHKHAIPPEIREKLNF